ncbi:hypothetical protein B0H17DRAFT_1187306 [Mycena rosella]|uniref:Uncharacterized protein n=1 Tax=Mycena rosella TaxID=1033263 RepID=A0AAD7C352_MYCRO|nr:hypothetical protein B0H17DRAFT_1187306 [Mycena rosella]
MVIQNDSNFVPTVHPSSTSNVVGQDASGPIKIGHVQLCDGYEHALGPELRSGRSNQHIPRCFLLTKYAGDARVSDQGDSERFRRVGRSKARAIREAGEGFGGAGIMTMLVGIGILRSSRCGWRHRVRAGRSLCTAGSDGRLVNALVGLPTFVAAWHAEKQAAPRRRGPAPEARDKRLYVPGLVGLGSGPEFCPTHDPGLSPGLSGSHWGSDFSNEMAKLRQFNNCKLKYCIPNSGVEKTVCEGSKIYRMRLTRAKKYSQARAQAQARPDPGPTSGSGRVGDFLKPKPAPTRPKPGLSSPTRPAHHYSEGAAAACALVGCAGARQGSRRSAFCVHGATWKALSVSRGSVRCAGVQHTIECTPPGRGPGGARGAGMGGIAWGPRCSHHLEERIGARCRPEDVRHIEECAAKERVVDDSVGGGGDDRDGVRPGGHVEGTERGAGGGAAVKEGLHDFVGVGGFDDTRIPKKALLLWGCVWELYLFKGFQKGRKKCNPISL